MKAEKKIVKTNTPFSDIGKFCSNIFIDKSTKPIPTKSEIK